MEDLHNSTRAACPDLPTLLAWHANQIDGADGTQVKGHVAACSHCQAYLADLEKSSPAGGRPDLTLLLNSASPSTEVPASAPGSEAAKRSRSHLRLVSSKAWNGHSTTGVAPDPARETADPRPSQAAPPWQTRPDPRAAALPPQARGNLSRPVGPATPPVPGVPVPPTHAPAIRPNRMHRHIPAPGKPVLGYAFIIAGVSAVVALALMYPAWLGLVQMPKLEEKVRATSIPQVLTTTVELQPRPVDQLPSINEPLRAPLIETSVSSSLPYALLQVPVPDVGLDGKHEVILMDSKGAVLWNQTQIVAADGRVQLIIAPKTMAEGTYTLRTVSNGYAHPLQTQTARFHIEP